MARPTEASKRWAPALQRAWLSRGPLALTLLPAAWLFGLLVALRRAAYRFGWLHAQTLPVPVIVIGNLVAGGAGKTPTVMAVVSILRRHGFTPGIISRGYGRAGDTVLDVTANTPAAESGDEPLLLHIRLGAPVVVGRDRVAAGRELLRIHAAVDVIVSDDGLQHLRLRRDAQVIVFDERGVGNGWLLPAGPLREPAPSQVPPKSTVLYNAPHPTTALPGTRARVALKGLVQLSDWRSGQAPSMHAFALLAGKPVVAAAGMARPGRFFDMLTAAGLTIEPLPLPDHHDYAELPWPAGTPDVIVTEKDAVKLESRQAGRSRIWVAPLDFQTEPAFESALLALLAPPRTRIEHGYPTA